MSSRVEALFFEVFEALPRQGPGSLACTRRALELCRDLPDRPRILDLGCGSGTQTRHLARLTNGTIVAVDQHAPLGARLEQELAAEGLTERVEVRLADMAALDLAPASFDLVWSEGALYNLGLPRALSLCAGMCRSGGYLAFTDAVWRTDDAPEDVREAFADYPTMGRAENVLDVLRETGWSTEGHFLLPDDAWWTDFCQPMEERIARLRTAYAHDTEALEALDVIAREPEMHRQSSQHFGYAFFVARRL